MFQKQYMWPMKPEDYSKIIKLSCIIQRFKLKFIVVMYPSTYDPG